MKLGIIGAMRGEGETVCRNMTNLTTVERTGMTHLQFLHSKTHTQTLAHKGKSAEARHVKGFVDGDDFAFGEIHSLYVVYLLISSLSI